MCWKSISSCLGFSGNLSSCKSFGMSQAPSEPDAGGAGCSLEQPDALRSPLELFPECNSAEIRIPGWVRLEETPGLVPSPCSSRVIPGTGLCPDCSGISPAVIHISQDVTLLTHNLCLNIFFPCSTTSLSLCRSLAHPKAPAGSPHGAWGSSEPARRCRGAEVLFSGGGGR